MGFDYQNFGIGFASGVATSYVIYRLRNIPRGVADAMRSQGETSRRISKRQGHGRYLRELVKMSHSHHLMGSQVPLGQILVKPQFILNAELKNLEEAEDAAVVTTAFDVVPKIHDFPYLHSPYHIETLSLENLGKGERLLTLLGIPGSGRTTALLAIALWGLGNLEFENLYTEMPQVMKEMMVEEELTEEEFREQMANQLEDISKMDGSNKLISSFTHLEPVYIHLANVIMSPKDAGKRLDPAEPLVRAMQYTGGRVVSKTLPRHLYKQLEKGNLLLLLDGLDDLPPDEQQRKLTWLRAFTDQYDNNFIIVAGPAHGYGTITQLGYTPVFLRPWNDIDLASSAHKWSDSRSQLASSNGNSSNGIDLETVYQTSRGLNPLEATLKFSSGDVHADSESNVQDWFTHYLEYHISQVKDATFDLEYLSQMGNIQLEFGYITKNHLINLELGESLEDVDIGANLDADVLEEDDEKEIEGTKEEKQASKNQRKILSRLEHSGLLIRYRGSRYQFRHPLIASYLAGLYLATVTDEELLEKAEYPQWQDAIGYVALHRPIDAIVRKYLSIPDNLLHERLEEITAWLRYAGHEANWRGQLLSKLGNALIIPNQFPLVRERIAAALVQSRDEGAVIIFRKAIQNPSAHTRSIACLSLGALGDIEAIPLLQARLLDENTNVQTSAALAMTALHSEDVLEDLVNTLIEGQEKPSRAVAETFSTMEEVGHPTLVDALGVDNVVVRRAAIYGLRRIESQWATSLIIRTYLNETQFYVRYAAEKSLQELQWGEPPLAKGNPNLEGLPWLQEWVTYNFDEEEIEALGEETTSRDFLEMVLKNGDVAAKTLAIETVAQLGLYSLARNLYRALYDEQESIREAAHRALGELQLKMGAELPAPA